MKKRIMQIAGVALWTACLGHSAALTAASEPELVLVAEGESLAPVVVFEFQHPEEILIAVNEKHLVIAGRDVWNPDYLVRRRSRGRDIQGVECAIPQGIELGAIGTAARTDGGLPSRWTRD